MKKNTPIASSKTNINTRQVIQHVQSQVSAFSGPLPSPEVLRKYDEIMPGLAERVVLMAEKEQAYRIATTEREINIKSELVKIAESDSDSASKFSSRGQIWGIAITILFGLAAFLVFLLGADWKIVLGFLAVPSASLVGVLITRKQTKRDSETQPKDLKQ